MKKLALLAVAFLLLTGPALAQKTKLQLNNDINTLFPDNTTGAITPSKLRTVTKDIVASYVDWLSCTGTGGVVYWSSGTPTCLPPGSTGQVVTMSVGGLPTWAAPSPAASIVVGSTSVSGGSPGNVLYNNSGILGGYAVSGTGSVAMTANPVFTAPNLGTPSAVTLTNGTGLPASGLTGTLQAAQFPALTGDVTTTAGSLATTIGAGKVTNSMLTGSITASKLVGTDISTVGTVTAGTWQASVVGVSYGGTGGSTPSGTLLDNITGFSGTGFLTRTGAGAYAFQSATNGITNSNLAQAGAATLKGNPTGSTANVSDFTIQGLTARGAPDAANDKLPIYDNAAGTIKYVTPAQIAGASSGTVTSVTCNGGTTVITTSGTCASRELLAANRTYYVRTDGSDSNNGLTNTSGGAFLTIQKAWDVACGNLDLAGYVVTIKIADGTYSAGITSDKSPLGGKIEIEGNVSTPANVIISRTSGDAFSFSGTSVLASLKGVAVSVSSSWGSGVYASGKGVSLSLSSMNFGTSVGPKIWVEAGASVSATGTFATSGNAEAFVRTGGVGSYFLCISATITVTGTPAFSAAFALAYTLSNIKFYTTTISGSATGVRYNASGNSIIDTSGGGSSFFPGSTAGTTSSGGQYL